MMSTEVLRDILREIEDFLYEESTLLDEWRLKEWLNLFLPNARYVVPSSDLPDGDPTRDLAYIADDHFLLAQRVRSLLTRSAHAEYPHSRTRRLITNVRGVDLGVDGVRAMANFAVYRVRRGRMDCYVGRYVHHLRKDADGQLRFLERKAILDLDALRPQGKISIIL